MVRIRSRRVAHAVLVFAGGEAVAWAEYGAPEELPNIHHRKQYDEGVVPRGRLHLRPRKGQEPLRDDNDGRGGQLTRLTPMVSRGQRGAGRTALA